MRKIKQGILFYRMLSKRFFKKYSFLLLLCAVPVLAFCLKNVSEQESGMLHIVLCLEDKSDEAAERVAEKLMSEESILHYCIVEGQDTAKKMVQDGEADAAWIFRSGFREKIDALTERGMDGEAPVLVLEQEDDVALQLSRIKLFGVLFPDLSYSLYQNFAFDDLALGEKLSHEELKEIYEKTEIEGNLFRLAYVERGADSTEKQQNYMTAPLRGMLALLVVLCGFAAEMFFLRDAENGVLDGMAFRRREKRVYIYLFAAMVPMAAAVLAALYLSRDFTNAAIELSMMALYLICCAVFCNLIRKICGTVHRLGACIPMLMIGMFVLCPVFFNLKSFRLVQYFLPPYYYLSGVRTDGLIKEMLCYGLVGMALNLGIDKIKEW